MWMRVLPLYLDADEVLHVALWQTSR